MIMIPAAASRISPLVARLASVRVVVTVLRAGGWWWPVPVIYIRMLPALARRESPCISICWRCGGMPPMSSGVTIRTWRP